MSINCLTEFQVQTTDMGGDFQFLRTVLLTCFTIMQILFEELLELGKSYKMVA